MNDGKTHKRRDAISAKKIDELVTTQAQDEASWEAPVEVKRTNKAGAFSIPADLAERAAFLARVHPAVGPFRAVGCLTKQSELSHRFPRRGRLPSTPPGAWHPLSAAFR